MQTIFRHHLSLLSLPVLLTALLTIASTVHAETPEQRLAAAGYTLPPATSPVATYVTSRQVGNLLFLSGHGECGDEFTTGKLGVDLSIEQGAASAEKVGLCMLATIKAAVGELSRVKQFVRILGMVNASDDFTAHPKVVNGFSDLMVVAFGDAGKGARAAVGMASLPFREPLINYTRSAFSPEKPQIVRGESSDSSRSYGLGSPRARCGFSDKTLRDGPLRAPRRVCARSFGQPNHTRCSRTGVSRKDLVAPVHN